MSMFISNNRVIVSRRSEITEQTKSFIELGGTIKRIPFGQCTIKEAPRNNLPLTIVRPK